MTSPLLERTLQQYRELLERLETKFEEIRGKHPEQFRCALGCHSCCKPNLTVNRIEAESISRYLASNESARQEAAALEQSKPHGKKRCSFLGAEGKCSIYEARPLVCRSHGAPLQARDPENKNFEDALRIRDVCPLNFTTLDLAKLPAEDVLNLDTLNTLLSLLSNQAFPKDTSRIPLTYSDLARS